ncbi:MAG: FecR domain-containing protein, partial [Syntrophaceae bacterium]|nr:FecR domain-containing protein [Syntrophaceae bacterium]
MSSRMNMIFFFLGLLSLTCLMGPVNSISSGVGRIGAVEGEGSIRRADQSVFTKLQENANVDLGDTISTDANSRTYIKFSESCHASLGEYSELCLIDLTSERSSTYFYADLSTGIARFIQKLKATSPPSNYSITTPNALIVPEASETPSDFVVQVHNVKKTCVTVIRGQVRVKNLSDRSRVERLVSSCKTVFVEEEQEPSKVLSVSTDHLKKLIDRTTILNTLVDSVPECKKGYVFRSECPRCSVWDGTKCVVCGDFGLICSKGKCVDVECGRCKISWNSKCLSCQELGLVCQDGRCVTKKCPPCRIWDATRCV